ncbi:NYN domain-containing protein [Rhodobacteraceae bacterium DSL-40]|uniref:NYN domain-containing protein n=1 Tax=Amaricoccus sp. B4 TaxID=3368557 RepID=UPI000DACF3A8
MTILRDEEGMPPRVAILVDGDNIGASCADPILRRGGRLGRVDFARVYVNSSRAVDWLATPGFRLIHSGTCKNASDLLLSMDAVELLWSAEIVTFVIATSDGDFTPLALRLRESGRSVVGIGRGNASRTFQAACSRFEPIDVPAIAEKPSATVTPLSPSALDRRVVAIIEAYGAGTQGMPISLLGAKMHTEHGTAASSLPEGNWRSYLQLRKALFALDPKGPKAKGRVRKGCIASAA